MTAVICLLHGYKDISINLLSIIQHFLCITVKLRNDLYCVGWGIKLYSIQSNPQLLALRIVLTPASVRDPTFKRDPAVPAALLRITASEKHLMPVTYKWRLAEFQKVFLKTAMVPISDVIIIAQYITFVLTKTWFVLACILTKLVTKTLLLCSCF